MSDIEHVTKRNEQEQFWSGEFGDAYSQRNRGESLLASNLNFFARALRQARGLQSCIEFGANVGMNLKALSLLFPGIQLGAIEVNPSAAAELRQQLPSASVFEGTILEHESRQQWDLCLIKGVLIHINPAQLGAVYDKLMANCKRYLLVAEYYNPSPVEVGYRGHAGKLFKRDFAGEILDRHPQFSLVDYGFVYRRDPQFPQDDITWFLLEKAH